MEFYKSLILKLPNPCHPTKIYFWSHDYPYFILSLKVNTLIHTDFSTPWKCNYTGIFPDKFQMIFCKTVIIFFYTNIINQELSVETFIWYFLKLELKITQDICYMLLKILMQIKRNLTCSTINFLVIFIRLMVIPKPVSVFFYRCKVETHR